jgi:hypothetical protein
MTTISQLAAIRQAEAIGAHLNNWTAAFGALAVDRLADPILNPKFYARVRDLTHRLRTPDAVRYVDHAPVGAAPFDRDAPAPMLHYVGQPDTVHVLRDPSTLTGFAGLYSTRWPLGHCDLAEAVDCHGDDSLGIYVTVTRPPVVLVFEACGPCLQHLDDVAWSGDILAEADARVAFDGAAKAAVERWTGGAR